MDVRSHLSAYPGSDGTPRVSSSQPRTNRQDVKEFRLLVAASVQGGVRVGRELELGCKQGDKLEVSLGSTPLKSLSESSFCLFLSPSSRVDAALFSLAKRSNPRTDVRGVGGSRGFAGCLNLCCFKRISM